MPEKHKLYLDQMLQERIAEVLRKEGYDVVRASEIGDARTDDYQILQKAILDNRILITLDEHFGDYTKVFLKGEDVNIYGKTKDYIR